MDWVIQTRGIFVVLAGVVLVAPVAAGAVETIDADPEPKAGANTSTNATIATETQREPTHDHNPASGDGTTSESTGSSTTASPMEAIGKALPWHGLGLLAVVAAGGLGRVWPRPRSSEEPQEDPADDNTEPPADGASQAAERRRVVDHPGVEGMLILGHRCLDDGQPELADAWFAAAIDHEPRLPVATLCRGLCRLEMDDPEGARRWLARTLELEPGNATARYHLARAQALDDDLNAMLATIGPLLEAEPSLAEEACEDPAFAHLGDDPRWLAALGKLP